VGVVGEIGSEVEVGEGRAVNKHDITDPTHLKFRGRSESQPSHSGFIICKCEWPEMLLWAVLDLAALTLSTSCRRPNRKQREPWNVVLVLIRSLLTIWRVAGSPHLAATPRGVEVGLLLNPRLFKPCGSRVHVPKPSLAGAVGGRVSAYFRGEDP
jgi:hypothetical protein